MNSIIITEETKKKLLGEAISKYKRIYPVGNLKSLSECFVYNEQKIYFWFNSEDRSTHLLYEHIPGLKNGNIHTEV